MGRDELKSKAEPGGFIEYGPEQLPKVNTQRRDKSQPDFYGVPILRDSEVLFTTAAELGNKPASCYTCKKQNSDLTCWHLGPTVPVKKFIGSSDSGEEIEYWPCCSVHDWDGGNHQKGAPTFRDPLDTPDSIGLIWINAPEVGQAYGGANCGGLSGADDCDRYRTYNAEEKWEVEQAYCTVLARDVEGGAVCAAWHDDDIVEFPEAMAMMKGESRDTLKKKKLAKSIVGRDA